MIKSRLKDIMEKKGITINQLSTDTGLAIETLRRARGEKISLCRLETLKIIAVALNVKIARLFDELS
jgi:DNA-binding Xre family transcriptional regulator